VAEYRLTPAAERDFDEIFDYTVQRWDLEQAFRYTHKLEAALSALAASPTAGLDSREIRAGYRRHIVGSHVIYFQQTGYGIVVIRILHGNMNPLGRF
jgi:toxin ParE1/3/4